MERGRRHACDFTDSLNSFRKCRQYKCSVILIVSIKVYLLNGEIISLQNTPIALMSIRICLVQYLKIV